jgi:hypothetical protein
MFVGSANGSYYPYELTDKCRALEEGQLEQPKKSNSIYVISHDVAVSDSKGSDNACTHVIRLKPKTNGTFTKELVFTKTLNSVSLQDQRDFLRELIHIKFPNTKKLVIDGQSAGQGLLSLFYESWEYRTGNGDIIEFPPLIKDDDPEGFRLHGADPMIRSIMATNTFNNEFYPYMKSCFEDKSLRLLLPASLLDERYKTGELSPDKYAINIEHDLLIQELSNIKQEYTAMGNLTYGRIVKTRKRDRAVSLMYLLSYIFELEQEGKGDLHWDNSDEMELLMKYSIF